MTSSAELDRKLMPPPALPPSRIKKKRKSSSKADQAGVDAAATSLSDTSPSASSGLGSEDGQDYSEKLAKFYAEIAMLDDSGGAEGVGVSDGASAMEAAARQSGGGIGSGTSSGGGNSDEDMLGSDGVRDSTDAATDTSVLLLSGYGSDDEVTPPPTPAPPATEPPLPAEPGPPGPGPSWVPFSQSDADKSTTSSRVAETRASGSSRQGPAAKSKQAAGAKAKKQVVQTQRRSNLPQSVLVELFLRQVDSIVTVCDNEEVEFESQDLTVLNSFTEEEMQRVELQDLMMMEARQREQEESAASGKNGAQGGSGDGVPGLSPLEHEIVRLALQASQYLQAATSLTDHLSDETKRYKAVELETRMVDKRMHEHDMNSMIILLIAVC
eukprot:GHVU01222735.1.p1 GENE.GHVU01222735.1~~GHVU01222735.1.p1  ORF type:complete len:383 (-),score=55.78 GHVU01222735.1:584-1732(-)